MLQAPCIEDESSGDRFDTINSSAITILRVVHTVQTSCVGLILEGHCARSVLAAEKLLERGVEDRRVKSIDVAVEIGNKAS
jgi:hypothetical protein